MANEYLNNKTFESIIQAFQSFKRLKSRCEFIIEDLQETSNRKFKKYGGEPKSEFLKETEAFYKEVCEQFKEYQSQLAYAFYILSENIANYAKFSGIDPDDAIQEGVLICFQKIDRFNPTKGKAFNYMTTCILNHSRQQYRTARNYNELKKKYLQHLSDKFDSMIIRNGKERTYTKISVDRAKRFW